MEGICKNQFNPIDKYLILRCEDNKLTAYEGVDENSEPLWTEDLWCGKLYCKKGNAQRIIDALPQDPYEVGKVTYKITPAQQVIDIKYVVKRNMFNKDNPIDCRIIWFDKGKEISNAFPTRYAADKELKRIKSELTEEYYKLIMAINRIQLPDIE